MPEVQGVSAADYKMPVQNQYATEAPAEETAPMVYDPDLEAKKSAASNKLGLTLLGVALLGAGLVGGHMWGRSGKAALEESKTALEEANKAMKDVLTDVNKEADKVIDSKFGGYRFGKDYAKSVKEKAKPFIEEAEKAAEETKEGVEKAAKDAAKDGEKAAKDGEKAAEDAAK